MMGLRETLEAATPGGWFVVGPPWNEGAPFINAGSADPHGGEVVCDFTYVGEDADWRETNNSEANAALAALAPELAALVLDMGEVLTTLNTMAAHSDAATGFLIESGIELNALLARLDQLGKEQT